MGEANETFRSVRLLNMLKEMDRLVLGLVPEGRLRARDPRTRQFVRGLEQRLSAYVVERAVASYEELEQDMTLGRVDVAWLPPLVYARLEHQRVAEAVVTCAGITGGYWSALVAASDSPIERLDQITGTRVAWVDPLSSAGYLVARVGLRARGIEPRTVFRSQLFAGSHAGAIEALLANHADVAATFVHVNLEGQIVSGPWDEMGLEPHRVRVLALLGAVPPDVIAVRTSVPEPTREAIATALVGMPADAELSGVVSAVFGARRFERGAAGGYTELRELLERAGRSGPHQAADAYGSTSPPSKHE